LEKKHPFHNELPIIQKTYDLILWYIPVLNNLPRDHKFGLGQRVIDNWYRVLEELIAARYSKDKLKRLESLNATLDVLRHQTRLLKDFNLINAKRVLVLKCFVATPPSCGVAAKESSESRR
jgi:hypothetical protein